MTTSLRHRRRAERFAQLLEEASGGRRQRRRDPLDEDLTGLVALRHELVSNARLPRIDPEFRTGLRAMLVATAEREGIGATAHPERVGPAPRRSASPFRAPRARTAVIAGVAVGAVAFTGMSAASENAMPGDALYGVKRSTERAQLALTSSDVGRGALYLGFAQTRLAEARLLGGDLEQVLDDMDDDARQGVRLLTTAATSRQDRAALDLIDEFVAEQRVALDALANEVGGADATRVADSVGLLNRIERRSHELRVSLDECGGSPAAGLDSLGPRAGDCVALPPLDTPGPGQQQAEQPAEPLPDQSVIADPGSPTEQPATSSPGVKPTDEPALPILGDDQAVEPDPTTDEEEPAAPDEGEAADDGGMLAGLNRLLGNLLGG
jgi:hypothetical protein